MKHEPINYEECMKLGFKRIELGCDQFARQYGFDWFVVELRVTKQLMFSWDCNTRLVTLRRGGQKNVKNELPIWNLDHLKEMVSFFKDNRGYLSNQKRNKEKAINTVHSCA